MISFSPIYRLMNDTPLISVIVPVYNGEKYLRRCLDSICSQTYSHLEILCVNDGSTDASSAILEEYAAHDERIKLYTQANAGLSSARNTGLEQATGEWVTGVDSDDYLEPDAYEYALKGIDTDVDIACYGVNIIWDGVEVNTTYARSFEHPATGKHTPSPELLSRTHVVFWNKLWRRELVEKFQCRFPVGLWYEDMYFWRALAPFARNIVYLPDAKINYVRQPDSIMSSSGTGNPKTLDHIYIIDSILEYYQKHPLNYPNSELDVFLFSYRCAVVDVPIRFHDKLKEGYLAVARQRRLYSRYAGALSFLQPVPRYLRIFCKHQPGKTTYGLFGLNIFTIQYKNGIKITRLLGVRI